MQYGDVYIEMYFWVKSCVSTRLAVKLTNLMPADTRTIFISQPEFDEAVHVFLPYPGDAFMLELMKS